MRNMELLRRNFHLNAGQSETLETEGILLHRPIIHYQWSECESFPADIGIY